MEYHKFRPTCTPPSPRSTTVASPSPGQDGKTFEVACDNVINGIGFVPAPVGDKAVVHRVGDCCVVGNLRTVIWRMGCLHEDLIFG